jgi:hypothetical protein
MGKKSGSGSGMNNPDHISVSLETSFFWLKFLKSSGMEKIRIRDKHHGIQDKHPGCATLVSDIEKLFQKCISSQTSKKALPLKLYLKT